MTTEQPEIEVFPCASQTAEECFPSLALEIHWPGRPPEKEWLDLRQLGRNFSTLEGAMAVAKKVKVQGVDANGRPVLDFSEV
jgi:hypothetical protein